MINKSLFLKSPNVSIENGIIDIPGFVKFRASDIVLLEAVEIRELYEFEYDERHYSVMFGIFIEKYGADAVRKMKKAYVTRFSIYINGPSSEIELTLEEPHSVLPTNSITKQVYDKIEKFWLESQEPPKLETYNISG